MKMLGVYGQINDLLEDARELLISARINAQAAEVCAEFDALYGPDYNGYRSGQALVVAAKRDRKAARVSLKRVERLNGMLHMTNRIPMPLFYHLAGKHFRSWPEYLVQYEASPLFQGLDPH